MTYKEKILKVNRQRLERIIKSYRTQFTAAMRAASFGLCKSIIKHALDYEHTKIGIVGSRRRNSSTAYRRTEKLFLQIYHKGDTIVNGGCPKGGDLFAEKIATKHNIPIEIFYPNWKLGRHAGFLRNTDIARCSDILIAVVAKDRRGGTEDTIQKFKNLHPNSPIILLLPRGQLK